MEAYRDSCLEDCFANHEIGIGIWNVEKLNRTAGHENKEFEHKSLKDKRKHENGFCKKADGKEFYGPPFY